MILVATPIIISPPTAGNKMRIHSLLRLLREENIPFHIAYINMNGDDISAMYAEWGKENVSSIQWNYPLNFIIKTRFKGLISKFGIFKRYLMNQTIDSFENIRTKHVWDELIKTVNPDTILIEYVHLSWLLKNINSKIYKVIDTHDVFTERNWRTIKQGYESKWISYRKEEERKGLLRADKIIAIQDIEAEFFKNMLKLNTRVEIVGHIIKMKPFKLPISSNKVGFFASSSPYNISAFKWFIDNVWKEIFNENTNIELLVGGTICDVFNENNLGIKYIGTVENVVDFYYKCSFTINPVFSGTGLKIKTIESLTYGRAIVATTVAAEGLDNFIDKGLFVCENKESFKEKITYFTSSLDNCKYASIEAYNMSKEYQALNRLSFLKTLNLD